MFVWGFCYIQVFHVQLYLRLNWVIEYFRKYRTVQITKRRLLYCWFDKRFSTENNKKIGHFSNREWTLELLQFLSYISIFADLRQSLKSTSIALMRGAKSSKISWVMQNGAKIVSKSHSTFHTIKILRDISENKVKKI